MRIHERHSYGVVSLIGDLGGVLEIMVTLFGVFILPISNHSFVMKAFEKLYLVRTEDKGLVAIP